MVKKKPASDDSSSDTSDVQCDFEFFDLQADDFDAVKNFLSRLLEYDHTRFGLSELSDLIISKAAGSALKVEADGEFSSLALLVALDYNKNKSSQSLESLKDWLLERLDLDSPAMARRLRVLLGKGKKIAIVLGERVINMPVQLAHPLYNLMFEDMDKREISPDYLLTISRTFTLKVSSDERSKKRAKPEREFDYFHPEDEVLEDLAEHWAKFDYKNPPINTEARGTEPSQGLYCHGYAQLHKFSSRDKILETLQNFN